MRVDEGRHEPGSDADWCESWYVDFSADDESGGFVRLTLLPARRVAWYWAYLVLPGEGPIVVRDHAVPLPRGDALEVRADALWGELVCETPMEHWGIALEAFGVRLDDPLDSLRGERGERVAVGLDLEWEAGMPPFTFANGTHYEQAGSVHGELLVGADRMAFDGRGERAHRWGDAGSEGGAGDAPHWAAFALGDDAVAVERSAGGAVEGYVWRAAEDRFDPLRSLVLERHVDGRGLPTAARYVLDDVLEADADILAAVVVVRDGPPDLVRALCRFTGDDGSGTGWTEWPLA